MQRSIFNFQPLVPFVLIIGLILYLSITSLYVYITPLTGYIFLYIINNFHIKEKRWILLVLFIYITYFEIDKGFFVFSSFILFMFYYRFFHKELKSTMACKNCFKFTIISIYYIGFYILNLFASLLFNLELPKFDISYIIYIITDFILVIL